MKRLINITYWRLGHLLPKAYSTDFYYLKVAQRLYDVIRFTPFGRDGGDYLSMEMAFTLAYYLEDVISDFGLWRSFVTRHKKLYGKYLPFYDTDEEEYFPDEIHYDDVRFLIWMIKQKDLEDTFFNPENPYLNETATAVYRIMDGLFEKVPINNELATDLADPELYEEFFLAREMCNFMAKSYLLEPFRMEKEDDIEESLENFLSQLDEKAHAYNVDCLLTINKKNGPLALHTYEYLSDILAHQGQKEAAEWVSGIEGCPYNIYRVKTYDNHSVTVENIEGEEFILLRNSFERMSDSTLQSNRYLISALVKYRGKWHPNGISSWMDHPEFFEEEKERRANLSTELNQRMKAANQGHRMLYFADYTEMEAWLAKHIGLHKDFQATEEMKKLQYPAIFIPEKGNLQIISRGARIIKDERNPYYDLTEANSEGINFIINPDIVSDEVLHFLIDHRMLPDACINSTKEPDRGRQLVQENIDFIARFMRPSNY